MIDLSIVIVSYNTKELLEKCLDSIKNHEPKKRAYEIIIVDNNSSDGSAEMVRKNFSHVKFVQNEKNVGFSKANNEGVKNSRGKYVLFLNPDTVVREGTLDTVLSFLEEHKEAGAATCKVELPNGRLDDASHRGFPTPWNAFSHFSGLSKAFPKSKLFSGYSLGWMNKDEIHEIDACAGAFMMVRRSAGDDIGWWDEDFFWYGEDLDFCYRLKKNGWKIYYVPNVSILHYKGVSGGIKKGSLHLTSADKETKRRATQARFDAMKIFYKKHYIDIYPGFITWLVEKGIQFKLNFALKFLK